MSANLHRLHGRSSEQPSSPATVTSYNAGGPKSSTIADEIFGSTAPAPSHSAAKGALDDLDDDFEGLEDAKEGSADDDFANISRDDFNPVFDSSPPASQTKSESTAFGNESSFDIVATNPAGGAPAATGGNSQKAPDNHDWDAIFAGLDSPSAVSPGINDPSTNNDGKDLRPPPPGRAITEQGEHDDPMVKNLTSMGYSRADAVTALEKYDYNLERVSRLPPSCSKYPVTCSCVFTARPPTTWPVIRRNSRERADGAFGGCCAANAPRRRARVVEGRAGDDDGHEADGGWFTLNG